jgi:hypothetical protein
MLYLIFAESSMFDPPSDNFENCKPSLRDFSLDGCGPCIPHEAATNHMPFFNWHKILGML